MEANVKGILLKHAKDFLMNKFSEEPFNKMISQMELEHKEILSGNILPEKWYPEKTFVAVIDQADKTFGKRDSSLPRQIGEYLANESVPKVFKFFITLGNPDFVRTRTASAFWKQLHTTGEYKVTPKGRNTDIIQLKGFALPNKSHCNVMMGFAKATMEISGAKNYSIHETKCAANGSDYCEYESSLE